MSKTIEMAMFFLRERVFHGSDAVFSERVAADLSADLEKARELLEDDERFHPERTVRELRKLFGVPERKPE